MLPAGTSAVPFMASRLKAWLFSQHLQQINISMRNHKNGSFFFLYNTGINTNGQWKLKKEVIKGDASVEAIKRGDRLQNRGGGDARQ